jgi:hypothetical protein
VGTPDGQLQPLPEQHPLFQCLVDAVRQEFNRRPAYGVTRYLAAVGRGVAAAQLPEARNTRAAQLFVAIAPVLERTYGDRRQIAVNGLAAAIEGDGEWVLVTDIEGDLHLELYDGEIEAQRDFDEASDEYEQADEAGMDEFDMPQRPVAIIRIA